MIHTNSHGIAERVLPTLRFLFAWTFLNVLLNLNYPARELHLWAPLMPSPEIVLLLFALYVAVRLGMPFRPGLYLSLTAVLMFFRLFRIGDVLIPMYFYRPFNLYIDSRYVPDLIDLLYNTVSHLSFVVYAGLAAALFAGTTFVTWRSLKTIHNYFGARHHRQTFLGGIALLLGLMLISQPVRSIGNSDIFAKGFFYRVLEEVDFILKVRDYKGQEMNTMRASEEKVARMPVSLDKLGGANVYLFLIESYGHTLFSNPEYFSFISPVFEKFEGTIKAHGFDVYSNFLTSPTYGGTSWLAFGTVESGIKLPSQIHYNFLTHSGIKTLARYFNDAGYRTVSVMPGTRFPWPDGDFFGYQNVYYAWNFEYKGPAYGWSAMPDQFVLDYIFRREIQKNTQPLFIRYVLISSHAPFNRQPPYIEDWSTIGNGAIYYEKDTVTFPIVWPDLRNAGKAYMTSIIYDLDVIRSYLEQGINDESLIIIMGDHQPNVQITGKNGIWSVPIHVISRRKEFLRPFAERGYTSGMIPKQPLPHFGMETFLYAFLQGFSSTQGEVKGNQVEPFINQ